MKFANNINMNGGRVLNASGLSDGNGDVLEEDIGDLPMDQFVLAGSVQTLENKRIKPRLSTASTASSLTPDADTQDICALSGLASALVINAPVGTPYDGQQLRIRISTNGAQRNLTWNPIYQSTGVLPASLAAGKVLHAPAIYNAAALI